MNRTVCLNQNVSNNSIYNIKKNYNVRIEITNYNSDLGVIRDFTSHSSLESLRLHDPNIVICCKISYNPLLAIGYFYNRGKS